MKLFLSLFVIISLSACGTLQNVKYSSLEKVGIHKRDILVDRIKDTNETQEQTKEQFKSAYEELAGLIDVDDKGLEKKYASMAKAVSASEEKADELDTRIKSVNQVAIALFDEWQDELDLYQSASLRRVSEQNMNTTRTRYNQLYRTMLTSQERIIPVLEVLQDNTLYLKHNLNARAVSSISGEVLSVQDKVASLIQQMEDSIAESSRFIEQMQNST